ncbi:MAG: hypothetical protein VX519_00425 [Myxococcota bacterium]|nr:hypothetical protein [Myxococcota bacterium]
MRHLVLAALMFFAFGASTPAMAGPGKELVQGPKLGPGATKPLPGKRVNLQLLVVHATGGDAYMDPALRRWSRHLGHLKFRYEHFELLDRNEFQLVPERAKTFSVTGGREVTVTLLQRGPERARLRIQVFKKSKKLVDTTVAVHRNGTFIVAGPRHGEGILVLPITASY